MNGKSKYSSSQGWIPDFAVDVANVLGGVVYISLVSFFQKLSMKFFKNLGDTSSFYGPLISLFWTSGFSVPHLHDLNANVYLRFVCCLAAIFFTPIRDTFDLNASTSNDGNRTLNCPCHSTTSDWQK